MKLKCFLFIFLLINAASCHVNAAQNMAAVQPETVEGDNYNNKRNDPMSTYTDVQDFIDEIVPKYRLDREAVTYAFTNSYFDYRVTDMMDRPAEKNSWAYYKSRLLTDERVNGGRKYINMYKPYLDNAMTHWDVPQSLVAAIAGIESNYGEHPFKRTAVASLGTLAFEYPRRATYFRTELINLFILSKRERIPPLDFKGSYAGAIGIPQFMPSNIIRYGKDGDGDGKVDVVESQADAIESIAYYINKHGWKKDKGTVALVKIKKTLPDSAYSMSPCDPDAMKKVKDLKKMGVVFNKKYSDNTLGILSRLDEDNDSYTPVVFFENACAIHRYNNSVKYTTAIALLADELKPAAAAPKKTAVKNKKTKSKKKK